MCIALAQDAIIGAQRGGDQFRLGWDNTDAQEGGNADGPGLVENLPQGCVIAGQTSRGHEILFARPGIPGCGKRKIDGIHLVVGLFPHNLERPENRAKHA